MKRNLLLLFLFLGLIKLQAQELKVATSVGSNGGVNNFALAFDATYLVNINKNLDFGFTTGLSYWFKSDEYDLSGLKISARGDIKMLPIALTSRFNLTEKLSFGIDLGYAFAIDSHPYSSGFYFAPKIQYELFKSTDIVLGYKLFNMDSSIDVGPNIDVVSLGVEFKL
ncbi:hypothetical protein [Aestuariibaculum suncheonense]|uniref:Outer membrane protein beta-barrel domain-containing protein n=1 Tax=Aestuariibaculum suncheonense TaxID=1028745 RepID=A0A8J6UAV0_9FLAO|nr:hypothetical protein [Aestuariibaculum suncheonense]MBD0835708.1 hypothetical protein [Aestuariibaculum suncheonense]